MAKTLNQNIGQSQSVSVQNEEFRLAPTQTVFHSSSATQNNSFARTFVASPSFNKSEVRPADNVETVFESDAFDLPLGRVIGQLNNKYILAENKDGFVIVDQHAAHERITYEKLRTHTIKTQPLLAPIVVKLKAEDAESVLLIKDELKQCGLQIDSFGEDAIAIFEKPADWDLNFEKCFQEIADEVRAYGHSSRIQEKLHLKLANYACHHSVRSGRKLNMAEMDALLRDIERTERGGECNHGRPVYKVIPITELDAMFERI